MLILVSLSFTLWLNCISRLRLLRSTAYSQAQKRVQLALIWALPILGACMVLAIIWSDVSAATPGQNAADTKSGIGGLIVSLVLLDASSRRAENSYVVADTSDTAGRTET